VPTPPAAESPPVLVADIGVTSVDAAAAVRLWLPAHAKLQQRGYRPVSARILGFC